MRRELLLIEEMIEAAEQAQSLVAGMELEALAADRQRRDALLWNFAVLGEAAAQIGDEVKGRFPRSVGPGPPSFATVSSTGTGRSTWRSFTPRLRICCRNSSSSYASRSPTWRPTKATRPDLTVNPRALDLASR